MQGFFVLQCQRRVPDVDRLRSYDANLEIAVAAAAAGTG